MTVRAILWTLPGSVLRYDRPNEAVAGADWDAGR